MKLFALKLLLITIHFGYLQCEEADNLIKYELVQTTPAYTFETSIHNENVVTNKRREAFSITILSDVPVLRPGMLQISSDIYHFYLDNHNLANIEPGTFDNQNITDQLRLESNKLTVIRSGTFKHLRIKSLDLSYNKITHLEKEAISDLPNLWEVHLGRNEIVTFHENCFVNTPQMWVMEMTHNNLTELGAKWFSFMKKNETVDVAVSYNKIEKIDPQAFDEINVWNLILDHNKIRNIPEEVFKENDIQLLTLEDNNLETLPEAFFEQKKLRQVNITHNPLECSVQKKLKKLEEILKAQMFYDADKKCNSLTEK